MAVELFNSLGGFSAGIPAVEVIDSNGNVVTNVLTTGNISANNVYATHYFWANGQPFSGGGSGNGVPGGTNTTVQFNDSGNFGGSNNFTFNSTTGLLNVPNINVTGNTNLGSVDNLTITGGSANYVLSTDGAGNLSWIAQTGGGSDYSNANVAAFLPTYTGNVGANWVIADYFLGNGHNLTFLPGANVQGTVANATYAVSADSANTATTANTANVAITAGTVTTAAQPNITTVGILNSLTVNGNVNLTASPNITLGSVSNLHISGGSNGYVLSTDGTGNLSWQVPGSGGNGSPGGNNTQIQYNDGGVFGGSPFLTFNDNTNTVQVSGNLIANTFQLGAGIYKFFVSDVYFATTASSAPNQLLYSIPTEGISGAEFHIIATDTIAGTRQSSKISSVVYGNTVQYNEYAGLYINGGIGSLTVSYNPGDVLSPPAMELKVSPDSPNQTVYKMLITVFDE